MQFETDKKGVASNLSSKDMAKNNNFNNKTFEIKSIKNNDSNFFQLNYNIFQGELLNGAIKLNKLNFIGSIGGINDGALIVNVMVPYSCLYFLAIKYISYDINLKFKVDINDLSINSVYSPKYFSEFNTSEISAFTLPVALNEGNNIIKFHGDGTSYSPYLGDFTLSLPPIVNNFNKGILEGSAYIEPNMNFVSAIGGPIDSAVTVAIDANVKGLYNLTFQYNSSDKIRTLKVDVNTTNDGEEYMLPVTNGTSINDIEVFNILISLNKGINTIRFHGDGINYGPSLGKFMISYSQNISTSVFATETKTYNIISSIVGNGAVLDKKLNMVTKLGGTANGFCTITIPIDSYGKYLMKINYNNNNRPLKIAINEIDTGTIYMVTGKANDIFSITIPLVVGINSLTFYGDGKNLCPDLGNFTLMLIENTFNKDHKGYVLDNAKILSSGVITGLGGMTDGEYNLEYYTKQPGKYILYISADTSKGNVILIDVNGKNTGLTYNIPKSNKVIVYTVILSLNKKSNTISFHGNYIEDCPNILKIEIILAINNSKETIYNLYEGTLEGSAILDPDTNFIEGIGGIDNGNVTIQVNAESDAVYDLNVSYIENDVDTPLKIDVNNTLIEGILNCNDLEDSVPFQNFTTTIPLRKGKNSIKFYGNEVDKVSKLGDITIKQSTIKNLSDTKQNYQFDKSIISEDLKKAIWNDDECVILGNGASFLKSTSIYIIGIGGPSRGGAIIDITIPKSDEYILTFNYLSTELNKKLLVDFNYANNPQVFTTEKTSGLEKKDMKTIEVKTSFTMGKNTIILSGDGVTFAPMLGDFTISQANKNMQDYKIISKELKMGAKEIQKGEFITGLGGKNKGYIILNINVKIKGQYDLAFKYTSPNNKRSLKIKINKKLDNIYILPITNFLTNTFGASFTIPLNLIAGSNTVEISGNGNILTPNIGQFTLAVSSINSIIIYDIASGVLKNGAKVNIEGQVINIGGPKQGEVSLKVTVPFKRIYDMEISYETFSEQHFLEILINDISIIKINEFETGIISSTEDLPILKLKVQLNTGNSIIKFKGLKNIYSPKLDTLKLGINSNYTKNLPQGRVDIANGFLENGAGVDYSTGLVVNLGGKINASVTVTVDSLGAGNYVMNLEYRAKDVPAPILIDVNGEVDGNIYILEETGENNGYKDITITLKNGKNTIKFYGDKNDEAPDLNSFSLTPLF